MNFLRILHISDLHLGKEPGEGIFGDAGRIISDAENFCKTVKGIEEIDLCVLSGDFIDGPAPKQKKAQAWGAAAAFVDCIRSQLAPRDIILCPGNHDIDRDGLKPDGTHLESFSNFTEGLKVRGTISKESCVFASDFYCIRSVNISSQTITILELNMMYKAQWLSYTVSEEKPTKKILNKGLVQEVVPGILHKNDVATLTKDLDSKWAEGLLIVAAHYPTRTVDHQQASEECQSGSVAMWATRHLASGWESLIAAIGDRCKGQVNKRYLYLAGDTHRPLTPIAAEHGSVMSTVGRASGSPSFIPFTCRSYAMPLDGQGVFSYRNYIFESSYHGKASHGAWSVGQPSTELLSDKTPNQGVTAPRCIAVGIPFGQHGQMPTVGGEYLDSLIGSERLFELGRYPSNLGTPNSNSSSIYVRLGHVRLGPILGNAVHMSGIVDSFSEWVRQKLGSRSDRTLFVGLDSWGMALAALSGAGLSIPSIFMTLRGLTTSEREEGFKRSLDARSYSLGAPGEVPDQLLKNLEYVVFFTDVIATGTTLNDALSIFRRVTENSIAEFYICSVICAVQSWSTPPIQAKEIGAILPEFKLPIVERSWLPQIDVLPESPGLIR